MTIHAHVYAVGLDIGSTTAKIAITDKAGKEIYSSSKGSSNRSHNEFIVRTTLDSNIITIKHAV